MAAFVLVPAWALADPAPATDAPVATATGHAAAPVTPQVGAQTDGLGLFGDDESDPVRAAQDDRKPHGFIQAGVGTNGYRQVGGAVTLPVGDDGQVTVAIDDLMFNGRRR